MQTSHYSSPERHDAQAQQAARLRLVAPAQQDQTRQRNTQPDATAQQPDATAQQPASPLEPPSKTKAVAERSCVRERAHASDGEAVAAATAGKLRGDGKPRPSGTLHLDTTEVAHPLARFLCGFLTREETVAVLTQHGPDRVLETLARGTQNDPDLDWHSKRLDGLLRTSNVTTTTEAKAAKIRAAAPVASNNATLYASKHPQEYIQAVIAEKLDEARKTGDTLSPQRLVLALKCNDPGWTVAKYLKPIAQRRRAELDRMHSGKAAIAQAEQPTPRKLAEDALSGLSPQQLADVEAIVMDRVRREVPVLQSRLRSEENPLLYKAVAPMTVEAAALVRSGQYVLPEPANAP